MPKSKKTLRLPTHMISKMSLISLALTTQIAKELVSGNMSLSRTIRVHAVAQSGQRTLFAATDQAVSTLRRLAHGMLVPTHNVPSALKVGLLESQVSAPN